MKFIVMLPLLFNITLTLAQNSENNTMMTDEQYEATKSICPQCDKLAEDLGVIAKTPVSKTNKSFKPKDSLDFMTMIAVHFATNPQDANDEITKRLCGEWDAKEQENPDFCNDDKLYEIEQAKTDLDISHNFKVAHCDSKILDTNTIYCFNSFDNGSYVPTKIDRNPANQLMMGFLCSDERLYSKNVKVAFGACDVPSQKISNEQMSCYCQYVNGQKENGLAWHCTDFGK